MVIIDHFSKFAEAVPCSHHDYDAITTSRLLLQKWFARHGTPTRMQSDNAPNLTAEVSNEFLKAAHVTKVTSTAGHPRTQGLVERQNRTLLTLLRVFCSRRMRDWDQHLDEVMGAYNSIRHATTGFSPYMLTRGVEKAIPLTFLYPEFAAKFFDTHEAYVDHVLARQQEIHDLVRRNTHQAQLRQKLKYDRAIQARAYQPGELVWVFCRYVPQKGSPKLMRAWRGPHKVVQVFQDGRVYVLDTGQKVHFERLKPHHSGPLELAAAHVDSGEVVVLMDPEPVVPSTWSMITNHYLRTRLNNCFQRPQMNLCLRKDTTGWTHAYVRSSAREAHACTTNNLTIPPTALTTNCLTSCCRYLLILSTLIKWRLKSPCRLQIN